MGGCASKPKDFDLDCPPASLPSENPRSQQPSSTNADKETTAQEASNDGESQKDEPLVDILEPNPNKTDGDETTDSKNLIFDLVSGIETQPVADQVTENQPEESNAEEGDETTKQTKVEPAEAEATEQKEKTEETKESNIAEDEQKASTSVDSAVNADLPHVSA
ncbi:hypothetical protein Sjap_005829 [Stephania japonica]|uniref:Uncharacterized protein n=1 Tax=Stephania japonica TaxID=461633 RepID=A0AAP0K4Z1_9MAGN